MPVIPLGTEVIVWEGWCVLVEEREDPAAPRRRGGVVVRERDLPLGQDDMASKVNERMEEGYGEKFQLQSLKSLKARKRIEQK